MTHKRKFGKVRNKKFFGHDVLAVILAEIGYSFWSALRDMSQWWISSIYIILLLILTLLKKIKYICLIDNVVKQLKLRKKSL